MAEKFRYGGQAVMEGVMMRGAKTIATVVRRPDGTLAKSVHPLHPIYTGRWRRVPFTRGVIAMLEAILLGTEALMFSTNIALEEVNETKEGEAKKESAGTGGPLLWLMLLISLAFAVGLFSVLPLFLTRWLMPGTQGSLGFLRARTAVGPFAQTHARGRSAALPSALSRAAGRGALGRPRLALFGKDHRSQCLRRRDPTGQRRCRPD